MAALARRSSSLMVGASLHYAFVGLAAVVASRQSDVCLWARSLARELGASAFAEPAAPS